MSDEISNKNWNKHIRCYMAYTKILHKVFSISNGVKTSFVFVRSFSKWGLPCVLRHLRTGGLLHRHCTHRRWFQWLQFHFLAEMKVPPFHLYSLFLTGCLFSVALSVRFSFKKTVLRITEHHALWSSDFPPLQSTAGAIILRASL